jgi:tetratricopeptide (TPR) repeat protein
MQHAMQAVIEKHFGPDDGKWQTWSKEKRRAYGGVYRYLALTSVQRQDNWQAAAHYLRLALQADPALATDLDLYYDLALGSQPPGYRGTAYQLHLEDNATQMLRTLKDVFQSSEAVELKHLRRLAYGTAYYALGLVAYNIDKLSLSRGFLFEALRFRPDLWRDRQATANLLKSFAGQRNVNRLRQFRKGSGNWRSA